MRNSDNIFHIVLETVRLQLLNIDILDLGFCIKIRFNTFSIKANNEAKDEVADDKGFCL